MLWPLVFEAMAFSAKRKGSLRQFEDYLSSSGEGSCAGDEMNEFDTDIESEPGQSFEDEPPAEEELPLQQSDKQAKRRRTSTPYRKLQSWITWSESEV